MEVEKLRADESIIIGDVTLIPITKVTSFSHNGDKNVFFLWKKKPEAVIIVAPGGTKALTISGEDIPLERFKDVAGLEISYLQ